MKDLKVGDLVTLSYDTDTIGIITEISIIRLASKLRYKVEWLKDHINSRPYMVTFGHYSKDVLIPLERVCE